MVLSVTGGPSTRSKMRALSWALVCDFSDLSIGNPAMSRVKSQVIIASLHSHFNLDTIGSMRIMPSL